MRIAALALAVLLAPAPAIAGDWIYEGTFSYSSGFYLFNETTDTWALWTTVGRASGRISLRATIPLIRQNTALVATSGTGPIPTGGPMSGAVADSGGRNHGPMAERAHPHGSVPADPSTLTGYETNFGDPVTRVSFEVLTGSRSSGRLAAFAKVPLADPSSFGTGEWDAGGSAAWTQRLDASTLIGGEVSYWHLGDMPDLDFRDPVGGVITVGRRVGRTWMLSVIGSAATPSLRGYEGPASIGLGAYRSGPSGGVGASLYFGFTETAPDISVGLSWNRR